MKFSTILVSLLLSSATLGVSAAELTLFGEQLRTVGRDKLAAAAAKAGATLRKSAVSTDVYDASGVGLPGVVSLEVVYLKDRVVMAQYTLDERADVSERFRKVLVAKYGLPDHADDTFRGLPATFANQYISQNKYRWKFSNGGELVYSLQHMGGVFLTYVNKPVHSQMRELLEAAERKRAAETALKKINAI